MAIRDVKGSIEDKIPVKTVLLSVFDKKGLDKLIPGLVKANEDVLFLSTGGTYNKVKELLGNYDNLKEISEYTGFPEMEGGLVKTLHPKIYAGILAERHNPEHQRYLSEELNGASYIDMVVVNLYPFSDVVAQPGITLEKARGNIDIGGPTMLRAAAKNFHGCASVYNPAIYADLLRHIEKNKGCTTLEHRFELAKITFTASKIYETDIMRFLDKKNDVNSEYGLKDGN